MEIHLVTDTNLFFECKSLEQLPWAELGYDPVVLILTKPVLDEIDKHKKGSGRTRSRALEIFGRIRTMLISSVQEIDIQSTAPRVVLRRVSNIKPDSALKEDLDYAKTDERLIGIVSTLNAQASGHTVMLFTDDTGPATTADSLHIPYLMVKESWRRPPSETTEEKRIKELEKDLATYRAQEPRITIGPCKGADESNILEVVRKVATPLTDAEIEAALATLRLKHPLIGNFTPTPSSSTTNSIGEVTKIEYTAPAESDIVQYRDVFYPEWIEACWKLLKHLHVGRNEIEPPLVVRWPMSNRGTRPASRVRIEFEAKGPLALQRLETEPEDEEDADTASNGAQQSTPSIVTAFPPAPKPPSFQRKVIRTPPPPRTRSPLQLGSVNIAGLGDTYTALAELSKGIGIDMTLHDSLAKHIREASAFTEIADLENRRLSMIDTIRDYSSLMPSPSPGISFEPSFSVNIPRHLKPEAQDPESFYYDWPRRSAVPMGALTCDLWRHQTEETVFEFEVLFTKDGEARGIVECTVHAENLTTPEQSKAIIGRTIESLSMVDIANAMVEACN